jgi:hypothetical protein
MQKVHGFAVTIVRAKDLFKKSKLKLKKMNQAQMHLLRFIYFRTQMQLQRSIHIFNREPPIQLFLKHFTCIYLLTSTVNSKENVLAKEIHISVWY